eukprot:CAMPEP_0169445546 /NCGR_PEP_ID=MMETSP1042-20121227/10497_1 /TAXON_ID=464988 /ORGANISM="Hemiselmis andersenii, Strain CCMP1180" /LENGTH=203 /DNA_ID=CAMNT_0009556949 /DNA_START=87 /DNA_END=695 /DNA_ORIENTATION=+
MASRTLSADDEPWSDVTVEIAPGSGGASGRCPASAAVRWSSPNVSLQLNEDGKGARVRGTLSIREELESEGAAGVWCVWQPPEKAPQAVAKYTVGTRLCDVHSLRIMRPSMGYPQVILNLHSGCSPAPLFFSGGGAVAEFKGVLSEFVTLRRCEKNPGLLLVNDNTDMLNRSLTQLEMVDASPASRASRGRASIPPSSPGVGE